MLPGDSSIGLAADLVGLDSDLHLPQGGGLVAPRAGGSPPGHGGLAAVVQLAGVARQTGGTDRGAEAQRGGESQDGEVVIQGAAAVAGVVGDLGEADSGEGVVVNPVFPHQDGQVAGVPPGGAVGSSEDVLGGDESASTPGVARK